MPPVTGFTGGDSLDVLKPDPRMLQHAADQLPPGPLIIVGDSETDAATAGAPACRSCSTPRATGSSPVAALAARRRLRRLRRAAGLVAACSRRRGMSPSRYRPIPRAAARAPPGALDLAGGPLWFAEVAEHRRGAPPRAASPPPRCPPTVAARLTAPRPPVCGLALDRPRLMGGPQRHPRQLLRRRPPPRPRGGARPRPRPGRGRRRHPRHRRRIRPGPAPSRSRPTRRPPASSRSSPRCAPRASPLPISIDTRNAAVARAAFDAGADLFNDVSALTHDPASLAARRRRPAARSA